MSKPVYWINRRDQIEALASAVRLDIVDRLVAMGPMSVRDLAAALGRKPTAIYHHLRLMEDLGLIRSLQVRSARGRPAQVYETVGSLMRMSRAPLREENREPMAQVGAAVASQAAKDYASAFDRGDWRLEGDDRNHWIFRVVMRPSPERLKRINALFDELGEMIWTPDPEPGDELISVAWLLSPLARPGQAKKPKAAKVR